MDFIIQQYDTTIASAMPSPRFDGTLTIKVEWGNAWLIPAETCHGKPAQAGTGWRRVRVNTAGRLPGSAFQKILAACWLASVRAGYNNWGPEETTAIDEVVGEARTS